MINTVPITGNAHNILLDDLNPKMVKSSKIMQMTKITKSTLTVVDVSLASIYIAPNLSWTCVPIPAVRDQFNIQFSTLMP